MEGPFAISSFCRGLAKNSVFRFFFCACFSGCGSGADRERRRFLRAVGTGRHVSFSVFSVPHLVGLSPFRDAGSLSSSTFCSSDVLEFLSRGAEGTKRWASVCAWVGIYIPTASWLQPEHATLPLFRLPRWVLLFVMGAVLDARISSHRELLYVYICARWQ
eukprot:RCo020709